VRQLLTLALALTWALVGAAPGALCIMGCSKRPTLHPVQPGTSPRQRSDMVGSSPSDRQQESIENIDQSAEPSFDDDLAEDSDDSDHQSSRRNQQHPFDALSESSLRTTFEVHPETLGSISVGKPNAGELINGVTPPPSPLYQLTDPSHAWGTTETVTALCHALEVVAQLHPGTAVVDIGHLSAKGGGPLRPHHSHQSGRDVDLGLYYRQAGTRWYTHATRDTLDIPRTWTLIRTLATDTNIELILLDRTLQEAVEHYAASIEQDAEWVHGLFQGSGTKRALIRHSPGHATHLHLRFFNAVAQESARRLGPYINFHGSTRVSVTTTTHVATTGDTLAKLAQRYHTTISAIRSANRMRDYQLVAGRPYTIPTAIPESMPNSRRRTVPRK
jgi:murein endopeptidase